MLLHCCCLVFLPVTACTLQATTSAAHRRYVSCLRLKTPHHGMLSRRCCPLLRIREHGRLLSSKLSQIMTKLDNLKR